MRIRLITCAVAAAILVPTMAAPAWAHITFSTDTAPAEGRITSFLRVGHGCESDGPDTVQISVQIPDGVIGAVPEDEPGWTSEVEMKELDEPLDTGEGDPVTEVPSEVTFSSDEGLDHEQFREFGLSLNLAAGDEEALYFPAVQRCQEGANRWVNIPASLEEWGDTEDPPPYLELTPVEEPEAAAEPSMTEEDVRAIASSEAGAVEPESDADPLVWVALALGALGLILGIGAFARSGSKT